MRGLALLVVVVFLVAAPSEAACAKPKDQATAVSPLLAIRVVPGGDNYSTAAGTKTALNRAINQWNAACGGDVPKLSTTTSSSVKLYVNFRKGPYNLSDAASNFLVCASVPKPAAGTLLGSTTISIFETTASGINCRPYYNEITSHEIGHALGLGVSPCSNNIMYEPGGSAVVGNIPKSSDCKAVDLFWLTPAEAPLVTPFPPPTCECSFSSDCYGLPGTGTGIWICQFCQCLLLDSPLVLYLPDYFSTGGSQSWWKHSFCGPEAPTVCLDWRGDGNVTCNSWPEPDGEVAFVVALSEDDLLALSGGFSVRATPWRHFFGNVTMAPDGDFPFEHGFSALAAHCDQEGAADLDLSACEPSLHVWEDRSGDGDIDPDEIRELGDLNIESLGGLRETGKQDSCGNRFPFESHATCSGHPGRCGTWLDVFFEPR